MGKKIQSKKTDGVSIKKTTKLNQFVIIVKLIEHLSGTDSNSWHMCRLKS